MAQFLGLITTESLATYREENARRRVFYDYPSGRFPLMGMLSLMDDAEELTDNTFGWWEERWKSARSITSLVLTTAVGPFANAANTSPGANVTKAAGASVLIYVQDATVFRLRDSIRLTDIVLASGAFAQLTGVVTAINNTDNYLTVLMQDSNMVAANYQTVNLGKYVSVIGTASAEGAGVGSNGLVKIPIRPENYCQIFRTTVGPFTGSALKMGVRWDQTGQYKKSAKDNSLRHMESMEKAAFFGVRYADTITDDEGDVVPRRFMGGLEYYLNQWDKGNTVNGGAWDYRPGGADLSAADWTLASSEDKRVIRLTSGTITNDQWEELLRRIFLKQSDKGYEKLVICGDKTLMAINKWAKAVSIKVDELNSKEDSYGMKISKISTIHGELYFKTHPLFKEDPANQLKMFIVDMGDICYHALQDRDTALLKNRQTRDRDKRKDEWLTEMGIEYRMPERHMLIDGLTGITV